ncbi:hypothetical protein [Flexivirga caeni]|uniref:Uncharacterized protein n=1 Tax=Flexivirga caeni TaxID=2294115 RepID=A0A3M9MIH4_9MICO|nr:hypothetical protein [Flexivirga caeni]RNI25331.1 hypothetical protein EFY87_01485 [Flexivirga caeni]
MGDAAAIPVTCMPAHQHTVPMPGVVVPDMAALRRVQAAAGSIVVNPGPGSLSGPSPALAWVGRPKHNATNGSSPLQHE